MARSVNEEQVFPSLGQLGMSNFALGERKTKKTNALCFDQSAFSNFALHVIKFQNSQYFSVGVSADDNHRRKSVQTIFSGTNGNIKEASHTLLAYYLVIDKV